MHSSSRRTRGVLFDSGDTLVQPIGGAWFPPPRFGAILYRYKISEPTPERLVTALALGDAYLDANHALQTEDEERQQFYAYYRIVLAALGLPTSQPELLAELSDAAVDETAFALFSDVEIGLATLHDRGIALGIVSNAWPSLERKYEQMGVRRYFDAFVISARLGCVKPDRRMYERALLELNLLPEDVLFVDDYPGHVRAAMALGMRGAVMDRNGSRNAGDLTHVASMAEVLALVSEASEPPPR